MTFQVWFVHISYLLCSNLDSEWGNEKFIRFAQVATFYMKIGTKCDTEGIVATHCRLILLKFWQHVSQIIVISSVLEV